MVMVRASFLCTLLSYSMAIPFLRTSIFGGKIAKKGGLALWPWFKSLLLPPSGRERREARLPYPTSYHGRPYATTGSCDRYYS